MEPRCASTHRKSRWPLGIPYRDFIERNLGRRRAAGELYSSFIPRERRPSRIHTPRRAHCGLLVSRGGQDGLDDRKHNPCTRAAISASRDARFSRQDRRLYPRLHEACRRRGLACASFWSSQTREPGPARSGSRRDAPGVEASGNSVRPARRTSATRCVHAWPQSREENTNREFDPRGSGRNYRAASGNSRLRFAPRGLMQVTSGSSRRSGRLKA